MSKNKKNYIDQLDGYDEDEYRKNVLRDQERRKNKRLANALRSKNIKDLMYLEEDEED
jgi:hypothetical protein